MTSALWVKAIGPTRLNLGDWLIPGTKKPGRNKSDRAFKSFKSVLRHEIHSAGALDLTSDGAVHLGRNSGDLTRKNTAGLSRKLGKNLRVLVVDLLEWQVETLGGHRLVVLAEVNPALDGLRLRHDKKQLGRD